MCVIVGYNGTRRAAPVLIDMLRKIEGIKAGCYTGIATIHEGKIYCRKLAGNLDRLLEETDCMDLPGTIGILHSRTPGGDPGDNWAHPFTCEKDGEVLTALAANGVAGCCKKSDRINIPPKIQELLQSGYAIKTATAGEPNPKQLELFDGTYFYHKTDIVCQNVSKKILEEGLAPADALSKSYEEISGENMVLMLSVTAPDAIHWCRLNIPMYVGFADHGTCLATVPLAFAEHTERYHLLPALSVGTATKDGLTVKKMPNPPFTVAPITPKVWHEGYERVIEVIKNGIHNFDVKLTDLFEEADAIEKNAATWAIITDLHRQGKIELIRKDVPGVRKDLVRTTFDCIWKG